MNKTQESFTTGQMVNHIGVFRLFGKVWRNHGLLLNPDNEETVGTKTSLALWEYQRALATIFILGLSGWVDSKKKEIIRKKIVPMKWSKMSEL